MADKFTPSNTILHEIYASMFRHDETPAELARANDCYQWLRERGPALAKCCDPAQKEYNCLILDYHEKCGRAPSLKAFTAYLKERGQSPAIQEVHRELVENFATETLSIIPANDLEQKLIARTDEARLVKVTWMLSRAEQINIMGLPAESLAGIPKYAEIARRDPKRAIKGPTAALDFAKDQMSRLPWYSAPLMDLEGDVVRNTPELKEMVQRYFDPSKRSRLYTGFQKIDEVASIGVDQDARFIGLLAGSNHGKSTVLITMLYNMAVDGARVMLVPLESSGKLAALRIAWLHATKLGLHTDLPTISQVKLRPDTVTEEQKQAIETVLEDLGSGKHIHGSIIIRKATTWNGIMDALNAEEDAIDVLGIDYIGDLAEDYGRQGKVEVINNIFIQARALSQSFKSRGLVVVTPLQANRKGLEKVADKTGEGFEGSYEGEADAIEWYSKAYHMMDLIIGVWKPEVNGNTEVILSCCKHRDGNYFRTHSVMIDPVTRYIYDKGALGVTEYSQPVFMTQRKPQLDLIPNHEDNNLPELTEAYVEEL